MEIFENLKESELVLYNVLSYNVKYRPSFEIILYLMIKYGREERLFSVEGYIEKLEENLPMQEDINHKVMHTDTKSYLNITSNVEFELKKDDKEIWFYTRDYERTWVLEEDDNGSLKCIKVI